MLEPRRMLTFREVARSGSFSEAARALSLSQPAVSQQVAALEKEVGLRLLERGPGGLALTAGGRLMLDHAEELAGRIDLASTQLRELAAAEERTLRVGASPSLLATFVPTAVAALLEQRGEAEVGIVEGGVPDLARSVAVGELHAAVCFQNAADPPREHPGTQRSDLFEEPFKALVPPSHRLAGRRRIRLDELAGDVWTTASRTGLIRWACMEAGFDPQIGYLSSDPLAIRGLVARGLAVTLTPASLAAELSGVGVLTVSGTIPRRTVYALLPETGAARLATDFLEALRSVTAGLGDRSR